MFFFFAQDLCTITSFLITEYPSAPIIQNKESQVLGCDVSLRWSLPGKNGCPPTMYTIYYREIQSKHFWHQINVTEVTKLEHLLSLECNKEYVFAVSSWNELGESAISSKWPIKTIKGLVDLTLKKFIPN